MRLLFLLVVLCCCQTLTLHADPLSGDRLYRDVLRYASLGEHRTGTQADHQSSLWLAGELEALGFQVERQRFRLKQFFPTCSQLRVDGQIIPAFPHWFPTTPEHAIEATLKTLPEGGSKGKSLSDHIAYLPSASADEWHKVNVSMLAEQAAGQRAKALIVAVPHPSAMIYARNGAEPYLQQPLPLPTLVVASTAATLLDRALAEQLPVVFELSGRTDKEAYGENVLARLDRGGQWVVISTPSSGWFTAAGERGGGVALFLGIARWVAKHDPHNSYLFVSNSGHELDFMGAHHSMAKMPAPKRVKFWLHLGASIGARQWQQTEESLQPLPKNHQNNYMFAHWRRLITAWRAFSDIPELTILPSFVLPADRGELVRYINAGYPAIGFVGDHRYFHTPGDRPVVTSGKLLAPYGEGVKKLLHLLQP